MFPQGGNTPLHWAASSDKEGVVKVLVEKGANINAVNNVSWFIIAMYKLCGSTTSANNSIRWLWC